MNAGNSGCLRVSLGFGGIALSWNNQSALYWPTIIL
jgi:hypothetical protein